MLQFFDIYLLETVINGMLLGGLLALLSVGLNLIFGVMEVVWICYAELIMVTMYAIWWLHVEIRLPLPVAMLFGVACGAALGLGLHQFIVRPVLSAEPINQLLVTGGVLFFLQALAQTHVSAEQAAIIYAMEPVFAALFGWIYLAELMTPMAQAGALVVVLAVVLSQRPSTSLADGSDEPPNAYLPPK